MIKSLMKFIAVLVTFGLPFSVHAEVVNINSASAATISYHLKGIGDKKASSIVSYREINGSFKEIEDITNVKGIGEGLLKKNLEDMSLTEGVVSLVKTQVKVKPVVIDSKKTVKSKVSHKSNKKLASVLVKKSSSGEVKKKKTLQSLPVGSISNEKKGSIDKVK